MVLMIIKGLFRRYERWNPVHPTQGTFWGMGIGIGCGVGWGPGFGPEVIGYVGAGCGVGFSVGITLAGIGVGLPVNAPIQIPYNAFPMSSGAIESARSIALANMKSMAGDNWNFVGSHLSCLRGEACGRLSSLKANIPLGQGARLTEMNNTVLWHIQSTLKHLDACRQSCWPPGKNT